MSQVKRVNKMNNIPIWFFLVDNIFLKPLNYFILKFLKIIGYHAYWFFNGSKIKPVHFLEDILYPLLRFIPPYSFWSIVTVLFKISFLLSRRFSIHCIESPHCQVYSVHFDLLKHFASIALQKVVKDKKFIFRNLSLTFSVQSSSKSLWLSSVPQSDTIWQTLFLASLPRKMCICSSFPISSGPYARLNWFSL